MVSIGVVRGEVGFDRLLSLYFNWIASVWNDWSLVLITFSVFEWFEVYTKLVIAI